MNSFIRVDLIGLQKKIYHKREPRKMLNDGESRKKSFLEWLSEQAYRSDETGDFARRIIDTENVPKSSKLLEWFKFIRESKVATVTVLAKVWGEYISENRDDGMKK